MWHNNQKVTRTYSSSHAKNSWALLNGISGWKKIKGHTNDGVTNVSVALNNALAGDRTVDVYIVNNEIERVVMH